MNNFCIVTNSYKDINCKLSECIADYIIKSGGKCSILNSVNVDTGDYRVISVEDVPKDTECIITIGGDGTLLHAAKDFRMLDVVFIGVNKGAVGFLAEIAIENIEKSVNRLIKGKYNIESRMMLKGEVIREGKVLFTSTVLNDVVIHRGGDFAVSNYDVYVNEHLLGKFDGDGVILSTPTGSTAYSLSAGGPVARPDSRMIILTPICSHTIGNRSIILSEDDKVEVVIGKSRTPNAEYRKLVFDGDGVFDIISGDVIRISKSKEETKIAKLDEGSFLQVIKDKLGN